MFRIRAFSHPKWMIDNLFPLRPSFRIIIYAEFLVPLFCPRFCGGGVEDIALTQNVIALTNLYHVRISSFWCGSLLSFWRWAFLRMI